ncbi:hypothetical protein HGH92_25470 [Chitinophaga varians]|uniref:FecR family protein n=1 Tax=Chitinophaga varians TaxID=2202339 RepID=A0A847RKY9_9BACT|nr:FecR domain-containing protein [Chitinophaga varians]NLR67679.1 hypothetical protein [Chitinophaga varians]
MEPNKHIPEDMLHRLYQGAGSKQDKEMISRWMLSLDISDNSMSEETLQAAKAAMLDRILDKPQEQRKGIKKMHLWKAAAAVVILVLTSWWALFNFNRHRQRAVMVYTTIAATNKDMKHIQLPDGSEVWLNARSRLEYVEDRFHKDARYVRLTGEGYFEIAKDEARPFIVTTDNIETRVLGTRFNIETYPGEAEIRIALVSGQVGVRDHNNNGYTLLKPNEMLRYSRSNKNWAVMPFSANRVHHWTNGHMIFEELPLADVLDRFAYRYGLTLQYDPALAAHKNVTGDFSPDKWQAILDNILFIHQLTYTAKNGVIYINKR